jgi:hypothetical protein
LGILLSVADRDRIRLTTSGERDCPDVRAARTIARKQGLSHRVLTPQVASPEAFYKQMSLLACAAHGMASALLAAGDQFLPPAGPLPPHLFGHGGEIYRGFLYPSRDAGKLARLTPADALRIYEEYYLRWPPGVVGPGEALRTWAREQAREMVNGYYEYAAHGADVLVLIHLHERIGFHGAFTTLATWWANYLCPYHSPALVKLAFRLPPPVGRGYELHKVVTKRYLPGAYHWPPINERALLPWMDSPWHERLADPGRPWLKFLCDPRRAAPRSRLRLQGRGLQWLQSLYLAGPLAEPARDLLLDEGSLAVTLLGRRAVSQIIDDHVAGKTPDGRSLGAMLIVEAWSRLVREAGRVAAARAA